MEIFIEKVRKQPCLWKTSHIGHRNVERMDLAWEKVAKECSMVNGKEAKYQWKKLRDSHREAMRRRKISAMQATPLKPWKYEEEMKFILLQDAETSSEHSETQESCTEADSEIPQPAQELLALPQNKPEFDIIIDQEDMKTEEQTHQENMTGQIDTGHSQDALALLFDSLCQKTRGLPKYLQLRVQREIFETVIRAEEEALSFN